MAFSSKLNFTTTLLAMGLSAGLALDAEGQTTFSADYRHKPPTTNTAPDFAAMTKNLLLDKEAVRPTNSAMMIISGYRGQRQNQDQAAYQRTLKERNENVAVLDKSFLMLPKKVVGTPAKGTSLPEIDQQLLDQVKELQSNGKAGEKQLIVMLLADRGNSHNKADASDPTYVLNAHGETPASDIYKTIEKNVPSDIKINLVTAASYGGKDCTVVGKYLREGSKIYTYADIDHTNSKNRLPLPQAASRITSADAALYMLMSTANSTTGQLMRTQGSKAAPQIFNAEQSLLAIAQTTLAPEDSYADFFNATRGIYPVEKQQALGKQVFSLAQQQNLKTEADAANMLKGLPVDVKDALVIYAGTMKDGTSNLETPKAYKEFDWNSQEIVDMPQKSQTKTATPTITRPAAPASR